MTQYHPQGYPIQQGMEPAYQQQGYQPQPGYQQQSFDQPQLFPAFPYDGRDSSASSLQPVPFMKKKMGIFFTWQVFIIWLSISGTIAFVCTYAAFRKYFIAQMESSTAPTGARETVPGPIHFPKFLFSQCSDETPCTGDGMECRNNICICADGYEARGKSCVPASRYHGQDAPQDFQRAESAGDLTAPGRQQWKAVT